MTTIVIASTKGGVGKTTTATALAVGLAQLEEVLLVDLDSQGQVSLHFGLPLRSGVYHWLSGELPLEDCLYHGRPSSLDILPGDSMTKALYARFQGGEGSRHIAGRLRELDNSIAPFVVIDTAAGGLLQEAALMAADQVVVPFRCEAPSIDGLFASLELVKQLAPDAQLTLLPTDFDIRLREHRNALLELQQTLSPTLGIEEMYAIRHRIAVAEAAANGCTVWEYSSGNGLVDVRIGYTYLIGRVLRLAGHDGSQAEILEALAHGKK